MPRFNQNKHQKYISLLQDIKKEIDKDQKALLTANRDPESIAQDIDELKRVRGFINNTIASIEDED